MEKLYELLHRIVEVVQMAIKHNVTIHVLRNAIRFYRSIDDDFMLTVFHTTNNIRIYTNKYLRKYVLA